MKLEHLLFIDSASYLPMPLRKLPEAFGHSVTKSWYPHYFNKKVHLEYLGPFPDISFFGAKEISQPARMEYMTWYEDEKTKFLITDESWKCFVRTISPSLDKRV